MPKKITQQEYNEYARLLKKYQAMRRKIARANTVLTPETGAGRLPQSVNLEREKKISLGRFNITGRKMFQLKVKHLRKVLKGGFTEFYREYKDSYLELFRKYIFEEDPASRGRYSQEQKDTAFSPKIGYMMTLYNRMVNLPAEVFAYMIKTKRIREFKYYYNELSNTGRGIQEKFVDDLDKAITQYEQETKRHNISKKIITDVMTGKIKTVNELNKALKNVKMFNVSKAKKALDED